MRNPIVKPGDRILCLQRAGDFKFGRGTRGVVLSVAEYPHDRTRWVAVVWKDGEPKPRFDWIDNGRAALSYSNLVWADDPELLRVERRAEIRPAPGTLFRLLDGRRGEILSCEESVVQTTLGPIDAGELSLAALLPQVEDAPAENVPDLP